MFAFIEGVISYKTLDSLVVDTGGIGYQIHASPAMMGRFGQVGEKQRVHTYLSVREDAMVLYGFPDRDELAMFEMLITVSGVGPKVASAIVADISPSQFALAVITDDSATLTQAKGLGKKGAQRIILELKDKVGKAYADNPDVQAVPHAAVDRNGPDTRSDAISALMVLGYSSQQASKAVEQVPEASMEAGLEAVIKSALSRLI